jgi:hypothetical protein
MVQLSAIRCSCITVLRASLASFAAITLCVASERVFIVVVDFVIDSVRKLLDTRSYKAQVDLLGNDRWPKVADNYTPTCRRERRVECDAGDRILTFLIAVN